MAIAQALKASVPVCFGYLPLGAAFGLLFNALGYHWIFATLSGAIVFAGAAQFLSITLLAAHAGIAEIFIATLSLNLRHVFYGFSLFNRLPERGAARLYSIFGLTDETYSVLTSTRLPERSQDERFCFYVTALNHAYWVAGCTAGAIVGTSLKIDLRGLDFVLTALFVVLTIEQAFAVRRVFPFALAALAAAAALMLNPVQMLLIAMALVFAGLGAASMRAQSNG